MFKYLLFVALLFSSSFVFADESVSFRGPWKTTNRKLDGIMDAVVTSKGNQQWEGRFYGVWQGVEYDYTVKFTGPADQLRGTATIDGASYEWTGSVSKRHFNGTFTGSRYNGSFDMTAK